MKGIFLLTILIQLHMHYYDMEKHIIEMVL